MLLVLDVSPDSDDADLAADWLWGLGATAVEFRPRALVAGFVDEHAALTARSVLTERWPTRFEQPPDESEWRDVWLRHLTPVTIGNLVVHPPWVSPDVNPNNPAATSSISIDPGRAFGSGHHPSTQLAIRLLSTAVVVGDCVLDAGCGTGVLGIAAARFGASKVLAVDLDADILETTRSNAQANGVDDRFAYSAEPLTPLSKPPITGREPADITAANMTIGTLRPFIPTLLSRTSRTLVVSGILNHQAGAIEAAVGAPADRSLSSGDWTALEFVLRSGAAEAYG